MCVWTCKKWGSQIQGNTALTSDPIGSDELNNQCNTENKTRRIILSDSKIYYKAVVIKTVWDQSDRQKWIESLDTDPHIHSSHSWLMIKMTLQYSGQTVVFNKQCWIFTWAKSISIPPFTQYTTIYSKHTTDLNVEGKTIKLLEDSFRRNIFSWL